VSELYRIQNARRNDKNDRQYNFKMIWRSIHWLNAYQMRGKTQQTFLAVCLKSLKPQSIHNKISVQNLDEKSRVFELVCHIGKEYRLVDE
jgi:hypothetical protein